MISLIVFQNVSKDKNDSSPYTNYELAKSLYENKLLNRVICLSCDEDLDVPSEYFAPISSKKIFKLISNLLTVAQKFYTRLDVRYYKEIIFDYYASKYIDKDKDKLIFCTRPLFPITINKAKKLGIKTCMQAAVAHPLFNFSLVKNEEVKHDLKGQGSYTNLKRTLRLSKAINETDRLIVAEFGKMGFLRQSYTNFIPSDKILLVNGYFAVDKSFLKSSKALQNNKRDSITFLHLSHMNLIKGIPYLLSAWDLLMRKYNVKDKLVLVGNVDRNIQRLYRRKYGNTPNIEFRGFVKDLRTAYEAGDVFISPSVSDAGPTTILEAMSMSLPVIISTNCNFSSLIEDGRNGFTYQFNDIERLTDIMYWCTQNVDKVMQMGANARKDIDRYSIQNYTEEMIKKIREIL